MDNTVNNGGIQAMPVSPLTITTLNDLQKYAQGNVVALPDFGEGQPFIARLRRPSMLALIKEGKIPNTLLTTANEIFQEGANSLDTADEESLKNLFGVLDVICQASLVSPTYDEIKQAGLELSDEQLMAIFAYSQQGIKALESFRK